MSSFTPLPTSNDIHEIIQATFDTDLAVAGSWGYTKENPTIIEATPEGMPLAQLQHMLTTIRAQLEMNLTQEQKNRYGGINANERTREESRSENTLYEKVTYEVTAMKEDLYTAIIKEYKEGYGKEDFDLNTHFKKRKEATLTRVVDHYFDVSALQ